MKEPCIGAWKGGEHGNAPAPQKSEKMLKKSGVIFQGSIFSNNFSRNNRKIIFFYWLFFEILQNFLKIFSTICVFRPNSRKLNPWFLKNFANYAKIYILLIFSDFFETFLKNFPKISQNCTKISQKFPTLCVFRPNAQKLSAWF